ncbi:hypothetical protein BDV37DRAFT_266417 [Aspergillus pseudonomiae]|uniref:Uncharacterized protein n=1 Tax=Aspergillus pseudonomiae TaxID=1506151 RepID=A0A5N7CSG5_9EURO|nr:uncharacterized protein BDV37DRAFT_266417 [Aspergillus pseudonomiae]KAE8397151.1 hypothetical protein BDV37DRAFT_266417 [Aspergillus pseudonomiae]
MSALMFAQQAGLIPRLSLSLSISACPLLTTHSIPILIVVKSPTTGILLATVGILVSIQGFVQVYVHLRHPTFQHHQLKIFCFMFAGTSTVANLAFCLIGTLMCTSTRHLFFFCSSLLTTLVSLRSIG